MSDIDQSSEGCPKCADSVRRCRNLLRHLTSGTITFDDYAYNATLSLVSSCDRCMQAYVASLPAQTAVDLLAYFQSFLIPVDFMPCPAPFIAGRASEEETRQMKQLLKPRYNRLYQVVREKVSSAS
jgi:hypothetical protein